MIPKKLAIYNGNPKIVNGSQNDTEAAAIFDDYDTVIFAENSYQNNINNIVSATSAKIYGTISATQSLSAICTTINGWDNIGVSGIYLKNFDYSSNLNRAKQNNIVDAIHNSGLKVMANSANPDDIFDSTINSTYNPNGLSHHFFSDDYYLCLNFQVSNGEYVNSIEIAEKIANYPIKIATSATMSTFSQPKSDYSYYTTALFNFDLFSPEIVSENTLILRDRKEILGEYFTNSIAENNGIYERARNVGIGIDTNNHIAYNLLQI